MSPRAMYVPTAFAETDLCRLQEFMQTHAFATLVGATGNGPAISHLPLLLDADSGPYGTLVGHFARANDHWRVAADAPHTAVFHGPHAYVSPAWYEEPNVVPTWNYVTVHASGKLRVVDNRPWLRGLVERTVAAYESLQPIRWRLDSQASDFVDRMLSAIVGFELPIERLEGKWKLSQNHSVDRRRRVAARLQASPQEDDQQIAALMSAGLDCGLPAS